MQFGEGLVSAVLGAVHDSAVELRFKNRQLQWEGDIAAPSMTWFCCPLHVPSISPCAEKVTVQKSIHLFPRTGTKEDIIHRACEAKTVSDNQISCLFGGK